MLRKTEQTPLYIDNNREGKLAPRTNSGIAVRHNDEFSDHCH